MKANQLRINNIVEADGIVQRVYRIWQNGAELVEQEDGDDYLDYHENDIHPVKLTEEWLLKFGFKEIKRYTHDFDEIIYGKSIIVGNENHCEMLIISMPFKCGFIGDYLSDEEYTLNIDINNVHQLQNLYFALTNEEL